MSSNAKARKNKRANPVKPVRGLLAGVLPDDFRQHAARIAQFQEFFASLHSDPVFGMVKVLNVAGDDLTLALPNAALLNYLRLHDRELRQMLVESFGRPMTLRLVVSPGLNQSGSERPKLPAAQRFDDDVCARVSAAAETIEDDDLRHALQSLAQGIRKPDSD